MRSLKWMFPLLLMAGLAHGAQTVSLGSSPWFGSVTASSITVRGNGIKLPDGTVLNSTTTIGGPITSVVAGNGLTGGGSAGAVTLVAASSTVYNGQMNSFGPQQNFVGIYLATATFMNVALSATFNPSSGSYDVIVQPMTDSTHVIKINAASGQNVFTIDTINKRAGVATSSPVKTFDANGDANISGMLTAANGLDVSTSVGAFAAQGSATMVNGNAVVVSSATTAGKQYYLTIQNPSGTVGAVYISSVTTGTTFNIKSTSVSDNSTVGWLIVGTQ